MSATREVPLLPLDPQAHDVAPPTHPAVPPPPPPRTPPHPPPPPPPPPPAPPPPPPPPPAPPPPQPAVPRPAAHARPATARPDATEHTPAFPTGCALWTWLFEACRATPAAGHGVCSIGPTRRRLPGTAPVRSSGPWRAPTS